MISFIEFLKAGFLQFSWVGMVIAALVLTHITIASVTIFLHRSQAHRALDLHPIPSHFFRFWLWMTTGMITRAWVAIHRKHHARCETEDDPHSPQVLGIKRVLFRGSELYKIGAKDQALLDRYGHGVPDDWVERNIYSKHSAKGILSMLAIDILLFGVPGIIIWSVQMMWIPFFAAGVINGIGHYWGYRNFECPDASKNIVPWGILIGGEELHNNHHTYGTSAKLSIKKWEFDIGWCYIRILQFFKLAKVRKMPPKTVINANKTEVDGETLKAILTNRFQVLAHYSQDVVAPVFQAERLKATASGKGLRKKIKTLLIREKSLVAPEDEKHLEFILEEQQSLRTVYQFRVKLQEIWAHTTASQKELIDAICEWCAQAEKTGIDALRDFAHKLKAYAPAMV